MKDYQRIRQLPLNGRGISSLFDLTPGVEGGRNARVNGLKVGSLEITLDGISMVDRFGGGIARVQPGLDTIQEFRIETVGSDARYSRPATVMLATRSGTTNSTAPLSKPTATTVRIAGAAARGAPAIKPRNSSATSSAFRPAARLSELWGSPRSVRRAQQDILVRRLRRIRSREARCPGG